MTKQELIEALSANGFLESFEKLEPFIRSTIRLYPEVVKDDLIKLGLSKIGGCPDLPENFLWPTDNAGNSLSFVAQINLADVSFFDVDSRLPQTGILYFFYSAEQEAWGFEYSDNDKFQVLYHDGEIETLTWVPFPDDLPDYARYKVTFVRARQEISLPTTYGLYSDMASDNSDKLYETVHGYGSINKMFGYADVIQNEMELECELVTNGLYCGDPSGYNDPRAKKLEPNAKEWRLLLQIDSNEENEMMWGDCGRLYFWIKNADLASRRFDQGWFILQCS